MVIEYNNGEHHLVSYSNSPDRSSSQNVVTQGYYSKKYDEIMHASIYPNKISFWRELVGISHSRYAVREKEKNIPNGILSLNAARTLDRCVNWLVYLAKKKKVFIPKLNKELYFKINFITLTLPSSQIKRIENLDGTVYQESEYKDIWPLVNYGYAQVYYKNTDAEIKELCLNQFFVELRNRWKCRLYLWKAETQKNGNIHFHVILDKYIFYEDLRNVWNRILNKLGYVDEYADKFSSYNFQDYKKEFHRSSGLSLKKLASRFDKGVREKWQNPNSTDVHAVENVADMVAYLCSYVKKNDQMKRWVDGNIWRCSELLGSFNKLDVSEAAMSLDEVNDLCDKYPKLKFKVTDDMLKKNPSLIFVCIYKIKVFLFKKNFKNSKIYSMFQDYIDSILGQFSLTFADL